MGRSLLIVADSNGLRQAPQITAAVTMITVTAMIIETRRLVDVPAGESVGLISVASSWQTVSSAFSSGLVTGSELRLFFLKKSNSFLFVLLS